MTFEIIEKDLAARIGRLYTKSGVIETPCIFPVINPIKQTVSLEEIKSIGFKQIITNAYLIRKSYGDLVKEISIHKLLNWDLPIMTDSGAYQLMEYGEIDVNPDDILRYEVEIGSDIGVILDIPTQADTPKDIVLIEVEETIRRARRAIEFLKIIDPEHTMLIVGPIQGGQYLDILEYSAKCMSKLNFDIYAIGSPTTLLEKYDFLTIVKMIITVRKVIPIHKPIHLFGVGHPLIIPFAIALGIDMFDTASYILYARDDRIIMRDRTLRLNELKIDYIPCSCPTCSKYSVKELKELSKNEREKLLAIHNLYVLHREIEEIKNRIYEGTLWDYLEEKASTNPRVYEAFIELKKFSKYFQKLSPVTRGEVHGINIISYYSIYRPEYRRHIYRLCNKYRPPEGKVLLILPEPDEKPYIRSTFFKLLINHLISRNLIKKVHVCFYNKVFGIVPYEICEIYPLSQHEYVRNCKIINKLGYESLKRYLISNIDVYKGVVVFTTREYVNKLSQLLNNYVHVDKYIFVISDLSEILSQIEFICKLINSICNKV